MKKIIQTLCFCLLSVTVFGQINGGSTNSYNATATDDCIESGTRNEIRSLMTSGQLSQNCHYVITDYNRGTVGAAEIMLHATKENQLSMTAMVSVSCDDLSWSGRYDIGSNRIIELRDNRGNVVVGDNAVDAFPWCVAAVEENYVFESTVNYTAGNFDDNIVTTNATVTINGGNVYRNEFSQQSNTTISSGDFRENVIESDATVTSSTTGDVDNNHFSSNSSTSVTGGNLDNSEIGTDGNLILSGGNINTLRLHQAGNLTMSGGTFGDSTIGEDAQVTIRSGSNYENVFGASTIYNQVGTGYIRYSTIEGTTSWTNGNTNVSNVKSYVSTVNTTGSTGTISNTLMNRAICTNMRNIASLTITDSEISSYGQITANNAARVYFLRGTLKDYSYLTVSAGSRIDASYTHLNAYSYLQSNQNGGFLTANYCKLSGVSYIRNTTPNTHRAERCVVNAQSNIRFDGTASGGRIYYANANGGGAIYQTTGSVNCYIYYATANSVGQIYTQNSTNARMYYCNADSRGYVRSLNNTATHYMYYCDASASGYVQANNNTGTVRMYAVKASSQSIAELRNSTGSNLYYSSFDAYFYAYITRTAGTSSGLFGMGRRTQTITNPATIAPYSVGAALLNF